MTVCELIAQLQALPLDLPVVIPGDEISEVVSVCEVAVAEYVHCQPCDQPEYWHAPSNWRATWHRHHLAAGAEGGWVHLPEDVKAVVIS